MIKHANCLEPPNRAAENFAAGRKRHTGLDRYGDPFQTHLVLAKPQNAPLQQVDKTPDGNLGKNPDLISASLSNTYNIVGNVGHDCGRDDWQEATSPVVTNQEDVPVSAEGNFHVVIMPTSISHTTTNTAAESAHQHQAGSDAQSPDTQFRKIADDGPTPANSKQGVQILKQDPETPSKKDETPFPIKQTSILANQAPAGNEKAGPPPISPPNPYNVSQNQQLFPIPGPNEFNSGPAIQFSGEIFTSPEVSDSGIRSLTAYFSGDIQTITSSKTLRVQIDLPELGKISARFGGPHDSISVDLTSGDEKMSPAVAEVQREMRLWLDRANVETQASGQQSDVGFDNSKGFQRDSAGQANSGKGQASAAAGSAPTLLTETNEPPVNQSGFDHQSGSKWRLI